MLCASAATRTASEAHPAQKFVVVGVSPDSPCSTVTSVTCSADHHDMIKDFLVTPAKNAFRFLRPLVQIFFLASELIRPARRLLMARSAAARPVLMELST